MLDSVALVPVAEAVDSFVNHLKELRYSRITIKHIRSPLNKLLNYSQKKKIACFSQSLTENFLRAAQKNYSDSSGSRMLKDTEHAMRVFSEFVTTGTFQHRKSTVCQKPLPAYMEQTLTDACEYGETQLGWSKHHVKGQYFWIRRFMEHKAESGLTDWNDLAVNDIADWLITIGHLSNSSRCSAFNAGKFLLKLLFQKGLLRHPIHDSLCAPRRGDDRSLAHIWSDVEIERVFSSIERENPSGKRDYAVLLMALRLAIRSSDIVKLTLDEIKWRKAEISFIQQKTGKHLTLPLPDDVADALVDYLRCARPDVKWREVFLRLPAPYIPMKPVALAAIIQKYRRKAGFEKMPGCGMHSLRHTLATRLMTGSVRAEEISAILGHARLDTTRLYLRTGIPVLAQAGLDPDMEVSHA